MQNDCLYIQNPVGGGVGSHNGRCSRGLTDNNIHVGAEYHARVNNWCGNVCSQCARELEKRKGAIIREIQEVTA